MGKIFDSSQINDPFKLDIKNIEVNYRGIFQKSLARKICKFIVYGARKEGKTAFTYGRYSDSPERNGVPSKYFAVVADSGEEELEAEAGAKVEPDDVDVSIVVDDSMVKGTEPWAWYGIRPINDKVKAGGTLLVVSRRTPDEILRFVAKKPFTYRIAVLSGDASFSGLWVYKEDQTDVRVLGALARVAPEIVGVEALSAVVAEKSGTADAEALQKAFTEVIMRDVVVGEGIEWQYKIPELPKWNQFQEGIVVKAVSRGERNPQYQRFTTRTMRPVIRFDTCIKCDLCWYACPDECFDQTPEGLFDVNYNYCVGCGRCAEVCPVPETVVMVDELRFENNDSPYEKYKANKEEYIKWAEEKKGSERVNYPFVTGTGLFIEKAKPQTRAVRGRTG